MKLVHIGDTHGKDIWKHISNLEYDKVIFHGDYVDSFDISDDDIIDNLNDIINFKKENPDKVILLIGNHDIQYMFYPKYRCSGFRSTYQFLLQKIFTENKDLFELAYGIGNNIFTHAGIHKGWYNYSFLPYLKNKGLIEDSNIYMNGNIKSDQFIYYLNTMFESQAEPLFDVGHRRGGWSNVGGPLWCDKVELLNSPLPNWKQVIGHTRQPDGQINHIGDTVFIDVLEDIKDDNFDINKMFYITRQRKHRSL